MKLITAGRIWLIGIVIALALGGWGWRYQLTPRWVKIKNLEAEIVKTDQEINQTRVDIENFKRLLEELARQESQIQEILKLLFPENKVSLMVKRLIQARSQGLNLEFVSIQPAPITTQGAVKVLPVTLNLKGTFRQLLTYLNRLEQEPALKIKDFGISGGLRPEPGKNYILNSNLQFDVYLVPQLAAAPPPAPTGEGIPLARAVLSRNDPFADAKVAALAKEEALKLKAQPDLLALTLKLEGIWLGQKPKALISGEILVEGQEISGWKIIKIAAREVVVKSASRQVTLKLPDNY